MKAEAQKIQAGFFVGSCLDFPSTEGGFSEPPFFCVRQEMGQEQRKPYLLIRKDTSQGGKPQNAENTLFVDSGFQKRLAWQAGRFLVPNLSFSHN